MSLLLQDEISVNDSEVSGPDESDAEDDVSAAASSHAGMLTSYVYLFINVVTDNFMYLIICGINIYVILQYN